MSMSSQFPMTASRRRLNSPDSVSNLQLWLKADAISGLSDGNPVSMWPDSSGNAQHISQVTASAKPVYKINILNGKPVVRFDGVDDFLSKDSGFSAFSGGAAYTAFIVYKITNSANDQFSWNIPSEVNQGSRLQQSAGVLYSTPVNGNSAYGSYAFTNTSSFHIFCDIYDGSKPTAATKLRHFKNGTQQSLTFFGTMPSGLGASSSFRLGMRSDGGTSPFGGDIAEVLLYNKALSEAERLIVESYLNNKYAVY